METAVFLAVVVGTLAVAFFVAQPGADQPHVLPASISDEIRFHSDGTPYLVHPDEITGHIPTDGIQPLDDPEFVTVSEADRWMR